MAELEYSLPPGRFDTAGEYVCRICPACGGIDKLYWNPRLALGYCFGAKPVVCHIRVVGWQQFIDLHNGNLTSISRVERRAGEVASGGELEMRSLWVHHAWDSPIAHQFLTSPERRISELIARFLPIWHLPALKLIAVDLDPVSPEFPPAFVYRPEDGKNKWMALPTVRMANYCFGLQAWAREPSPILVVCEGVFDVLSTGLYSKAIAVMGSKLRTPLACWLNLAYRNKPFIAITWTDADRPGEVADKQFAAALKGWGIPSISLRTPKDPKWYSPDETRHLIAARLAQHRLQRATFSLS